ncbi:MAG TPA: metallophosphoesterase family protein [Acidimicrobiales bacterium]|nr:metallophosphoesterase family protein [Acidimicrobiales bacterium]
MAVLRDLARRHRSAAAALLGCLALGALAGALSFAVQPDVHGPLGPGDVTIDVGVRSSRTTLDLPPLGRILADSHDGPVGFDVRVDRIDLQQAGDLAGALARGSDPAARLRTSIEADLRPLLRTMALRSVVVAIALGVVAGLVLPRRRRRYVAAAVAGSVGFVALAGGMAASSFRPTSFDQPRFEGTLAAAPDVLNTVQRHIDDVSIVQSRLEALSMRLEGLYRSVDGAGPSFSELTILHVSDLHSNPVGIELVEQTAERFDVDAIIDTGDLTSFGATVEELTVQRIARMRVPYYVVPGNHDHPDIRAALDAAGVEVLDPGITRIGDVEVLGVGEPTYTADNRLPLERWDRMLDRSAREVESRVAISRPDVVAVHNKRQLRLALGDFAVGLAGHTHTPDLFYEEGSLVAVAGSAGATGVGALTSSNDLPYQMQLLQFEDGRLVAVDRLSFEGTDGEFALERILVEPEQIEAYPDPDVTTFEEGPFAPLVQMTRPG